MTQKFAKHTGESLSMQSKRLAQIKELAEPLEYIVGGILDLESPWCWALSIVEESVHRYNADVATLWKVDGNLLSMVGGRLKGADLLPRGHCYELNWHAKTWSQLDNQGITAGVAVLNEAVSINSLEELKRHPARKGHLDQYLYRDIPGGPLNETNGFGCLFAVPLRLTEGGARNIQSVAGVFKIERRRHGTSIIPFDDVDRANFELVADNLEYLIRRSHERKALVSRYVESTLQAVSYVNDVEHRRRVRLLVNFGKAFQSMAAIGMDLGWARQAQDLLMLDLPEAISWIEQVRAGIRQELRPQTEVHRQDMVVGHECVTPSAQADTKATAETIRDQVIALVKSAEAQPIPTRSPDYPSDIHVELLIRAAAEGFENSSVSRATKETALTNLTSWLLNPGFDEYRPQLEWLIQNSHWHTLLDSFHQILPFGTGGRRGSVGIGTNRFNAVTLRSSVQGHVKYLSERYPGQELAVVIAYDVREFRDMRGIYNAGLPNPLLGITSLTFAQLAAEEYTAHLVRVYLPQKGFMTTPELSFAIRNLGAHGGLNISASHNHPDDNGGKFYGAHGGQEVPPFDEQMADKVEQFLRQRADQGPRLSTKLGRMPLDQAKERGLLLKIPDDIHRSYIDTNLRQSLRQDARSARVVFTPLHGTGATSVLEVLKKAGFDVVVVEKQSTFDGSFPTVPFRAPNPEVPESMQAAVEVASQLNADLVLACDPDADRIGACVKTNVGFRFLTGNEVALLVTKYKLETMKACDSLPSHPLVIKTEVTTELLRPLTHSFGGSIIGDLLVGFKYHADVLNQLEKEPADRSSRLQNAKLTLADFIIAIEESHGVLITHEMRDKDAAGAALLLAELASVQNAKGETVADYLDRIYREYGYYANIVRSTVMSGAEGLSQMRRIEDELRQHPPKVIAGFAVSMPVVDRQNRADPVFGELLGETDFVARNVLIFHLENGARVVIRPSGTEPKNKVYVEVPSAALGLGADASSLERTKASTIAVAHAIADDFTRQMLAIIGIELPLYALRISGLVSLDRRIVFARDFIPSLEARVRELINGTILKETVSDWIDQSLSSYGSDARGLVSEAVSAYVTAELTKSIQLSDHARNERLLCLNLIASFFGIATSAAII